MKAPPRSPVSPRHFRVELLALRTLGQVSLSGTPHPLPWLPLHSHPGSASRAGASKGAGGGPGEWGPDSTWVWLQQPLEVGRVMWKEEPCPCGLRWKTSLWSLLEQTGSFPRVRGEGPHGAVAS